MKRLLTLSLLMLLCIGEAFAAENQSVPMAPASTEPVDLPPIKRNVARCPEVVITEDGLLIVSNVDAASIVEVELALDGELVFSTLLEGNLTTQLPDLETGRQFTLLLRINGTLWSGDFIRV